MLSSSSSNRKRLRSEDCVYSLQRKTFVNQQIIDSRNEEKMKEIQDRTLRLLFKGARNLYNGKLPPLPYKEAATNNIRLTGSGIVEFLDEGTNRQITESKNDMAALSRTPSKCCKKLTLIQNNCSNCSLAICEYCGYSCIGCGTYLCTACVCLFECGGEEKPCCCECKFYHIVD